MEREVNATYFVGNYYYYSLPAVEIKRNLRRKRQMVDS